MPVLRGHAAALPRRRARSGRPAPPPARGRARRRRGAGRVLTPFVHRSEVVAEDLRSLAAEVDPSAPGYGSHLNFDQILRRCGQAWIVFLGAVGYTGGVLVPRVEVDYLAEVGLGPLDVAVAVLAVGRTSFRLALDVSQAGTVAARAQAVLVSYDYGLRAARVLTDAQRAALAPHLRPHPDSHPHPGAV